MRRRRSQYRSGWLGGVMLLMHVGGAVAQAAPTAACARTEFEAVVDDAGEALRVLTQKNSPTFQGKLRALKVKRGWTHEQFLAEGVRFVRDETIAGFEQKSSVLLAKINGAGADTKAAADCAQLAALQSDMRALVAIQDEKWSYMFSTIDAELAK